MHWIIAKLKRKLGTIYSEVNEIRIYNNKTYELCFRNVIFITNRHRMNWGPCELEALSAC